MPQYTEGCIHFLCSALNNVKKGVSSGLSWVESLPTDIVSASAGLGSLWNACGDRPLTPSEHARLHVGSPIKLSTMGRVYQKERLKSPAATTLQFPGEELSVSVGQFVQLKTSDRHRSNWIALVTEVHSVGFTDAGFTGYFFYSEADIREYPHCYSFKAESAQELFPTFHRFFFPLTTVLGPVEVFPAIFHRDGAESFYYSNFFDIEKLSIRKIEFGDCGDNCGVLLTYMRNDFVCMNPQYLCVRHNFVQIFICKLALYCQRKDFPHSRRGPRWTIEFDPKAALLSLPADLLDSCTFSQRHMSFVFRASHTRNLSLLLGKGWDVVLVLARKTGHERLKFVVTGSVTITFPLIGHEIGVQIEGLRKFNGSGVLQWDSTKCGRIPSRGSNRSRPSSNRPVLIAAESQFAEYEDASD